MSHLLVHNSYGKARVRVVVVDRSGPAHTVRDLTVTTTLTGAFERAYTDGENDAVLTTDAMKNTVLAMARTHVRGRSLEQFARALAGRFLEATPAAAAAEIEIEEHGWLRSTVGGGEHPHAFQTGSPERFLATVEVRRDGEIRRSGGIAGLRLLKTTGSAFSGFLREDYSTMPDIADRVFAPVITIRWAWLGDDARCDEVRRRARDTIIEEFAAHRESRSAQHSAYAVCSALLNAYDALDELRIEWPGRLHHLVDLSPFGEDNPGVVYVPADEPPGFVTAAVSRDGRVG